MREVQVAIELVCHPYIACLYSSMTGIGLHGIWRIVLLCKVVANVFEQDFLITLYGKMIVRLAFFNQMTGERPLRQ